MQAKDWIRWDSKFIEHPKAIGMDWRGCVYFWQLCCISKRYEFTGEVPHAHAAPAYIASKLPGIGTDTMEAGRQQVIDAGFVDDDGGTLTIRNWLKWQSMTDAERKRRSRSVTACPENTDKSGQGRTVVDKSGQCPSVSDKTETETETNTEPPNGGMSSKPDPRTKDAQDVFDYWKEQMGKTRAKFITKRRTAIRARFKEGYTVEDCKLAIDGCKASAYHMGDNTEGKDGAGVVYDGFQLIFRAGNVERFQGYATNKPATFNGIQADGIYREPNRKDKVLF